MLRSLVARSQLLLSHLRWAAVAPVGAKPRILPSRAYAGPATPAARCNGSADGQAAAAARHLYLVLQERAMNRFSIYKLPDEDLNDDAAATDEAARCLPPAALRLHATLVGDDPHFEALGNMIVVTGDSDTISEKSDSCQFITLLYDIKTGTLQGGRMLQEEDATWIKDGYHAAAPVAGNRLCVLEGDGNKPIYLDEAPAESSFYQDEWAWEQGPSALPRNATGYDIRVKSHAVHPNGRTIFASSSFTFSLDTESGESFRRGNWHLPFHGRAYYDNGLDAWVGIRVADGTEGGSPYLCACKVPATITYCTKLPEPKWKMCKEELTFIDAPTRARNPTLVHIGRGKFCLVEANERAEACVTMFSAKYGRKGELEVTPCRPGRSYLVPNYSGGLHTAFWM